MTIRIADLTAEVDANDSLRLRDMARRVLEHRPALRRVRLEVGGRPAELYGRSDRAFDFEPRLILRGEGIERVLGPDDRDALEPLARDRANPTN